MHAVGRHEYCPQTAAAIYTIGRNLNDERINKAPYGADCIGARKGASAFSRLQHVGGVQNIVDDLNGVI